MMQTTIRVSSYAANVCGNAVLDKTRPMFFFQEYCRNKFITDHIPILAMVNGETGRVIQYDAREAIEKDPEGKDFPWKDGYVKK